MGCGDEAKLHDDCTEYEGTILSFGAAKLLPGDNLPPSIAIPVTN
jgi:hypothetical protein